MHTDGVIGGLAASRRGVVTFAELRAAGVTRRQIETRLASGHLIRLHRGVYAVGHTHVGPLGRGAAALSAAGPAAMLSHRFGVALHGLGPFPDAIDVTVPRSGARPPGLTVHRPKKLPPCGVRHGLRVTTAERTLLDLAKVADRAELERVVDEAYVRRLVTTPSLRAHLDGSHRGAIALQHVVDGPRTRSPLEGRFVRLLRTGRLPSPLVNVLVNGYLVDFAWPDRKVLAETDGWGPHGGYGAFNADRARDLDHTAAGWRPIRITARHVERDAYALLARLGRLLLD